jgi:hypothetical protein
MMGHLLVLPNFVVIGSIPLQDRTQVDVAHDEVIEALAPDRNDQPFSESILPERCRE